MVAQRARRQRQAFGGPEVRLASALLPDVTGPITKFEGSHRFLSNLWHVRVVLDGHTYPSVEHAFQAARTLDPSVRARVRACTYASAAAAAVTGAVERPGWSRMHKDVMKDLLLQKFDPKNRCAERLLQTGESELIWNNHVGDRFWGCSGGVGENHLGLMLMEIRTNLER